MVDDFVTRIAWGILLGGEPFDLVDWQDALRQPFDPWVTKTDDGLVLRSSLLDPAISADEAYVRAKALMDQVNGALCVSHGARTVRIESIVEFLSNDSCRRLKFAQFRVTDSRDRVQGVAVAIGPDGKPIPSPPPERSDPQTWLSIAAENDLLADALIYFSRSENWFDIFKGLECLFLEFGPSEAEFLDLGWANRSEITLLKRTANAERHARKKYKPPSNPMGRVQARELLATLLARAFHEAQLRPPNCRKTGSMQKFGGPQGARGKRRRAL